MTPLPLDEVFRLAPGPVPAQLVVGRLTDVALGGALAVRGTLIAGAGRRRAQREPQAG